jgi:hypothetical protein
MYVLYFCSTVSLNNLIATKAIVTQLAAKGQAAGHAERTANGTWQDATKNLRSTFMYVCLNVYLRVMLITYATISR